MIKRLLRLFQAQQKGYKSPIHHLLDRFDNQTPQHSDAQQHEIQKHQILFSIRDQQQ